MMPQDHEAKDSKRALKDNAIVWLLCHYPNTCETDERIAKAHALHLQLGLPIWVFGSRMAYYSSPTEQYIKDELVKRGVSEEAIVCSGEMEGIAESFDTVQETFNVATAAKRHGVTRIICVSNRLQLWQVKGLLRREPLTMTCCPTTLKEWRWWYLTARLCLIPIAFFGFGQRFVPLNFIRQARAKWRLWPF